MLVERDTVRGPGDVGGGLLVEPPPPQLVVKIAAATALNNTMLSRNRRNFMSHLFLTRVHRGPEIFYLLHFVERYCFRVL